MDTRIERLVRTDTAVMFELAAAVEDWPRLLPHYRWVRLIGEPDPHGVRVVDMAARRDVVGALGFPLRWQARQIIDRTAPEVRFEHIGGPTRGMRVAWTFTPQPDGQLRVAIRHVFEPRWPVPSALIHLIVGDYFVNGVAARTLRRLGEVAEARARRLP